MREEQRLFLPRCNEVMSAQEVQGTVADSERIFLVPAGERTGWNIP